MKNKIKKIFFLILSIVLIGAFLWILEQKFNFIINEKDPTITDFVIINDYQGENFSSLDDFHENSINGPQYIDREKYKLKLGGLVENSKDLNYYEVINDYNMHKKVARLNCVEGWNVNILWEGVLVSDLLKDLKIKPGASTVIFKAYDGYTTSFPLDYVLDNKIIMAYKMNDQEIPPERGFPFQLVAESKWGYKWIKWITEIEISDNADYEGFWESRGYSNSGDLDKPKFDN